MSKIKSFIIVLAGLFLTSSLFAKAPDWINGPTKKYPLKAYFTAVGEATSKTGAEMKAVESLASVFGQNVKSETKADKRMKQVQNKNGSESAISSSLDQSVLRQVDAMNLIGVEIVDSYQDEKNARWYVLAVMDKPKTAQIYSDMIKNNYSIIKSLLDNSYNSGDPFTFDSYSRLDCAVMIAKVTEQYVARVSVIDPDAASRLNNPDYAAVKINSYLREVAMGIPVMITVEDDEDGRIRKAFEKAISAAGLNTARGSDERYQITCNISYVSSVIRNRPCIEYSVDASLRDTFYGEELIPLGFVGKEGGNNEQQALILVKNRIAEEILKTFKGQFSDYLQSLSIN